MAQPAPLAKLVAWAEKVLRSFDPTIHSVDTHALEQLGRTDGPGVDPDAVFVKQVFYGCVRWKKFLKLFLASFYHLYSSSVARSDYMRFMIVAYITFFRVDDMGWEHFRRLALALDPPSTHHLLSYCFDIPRLTEWVKDEWISVVDLSFVEDTIFAGLRKHAQDAAALLAELDARAFGMQQAANEEEELKRSLAQPLKKPPTKPRPFNLTRPKPPKLPTPRRIEQAIAAKPMPQDLDDVTLAGLEQEAALRKERARRETHAKYEALNAAAPQLHESKANIEELRRRVDEERYRDCTFEPQVPSSGAAAAAAAERPPAPVRLNVAAVLREDALYRKRQQQEAALIEAYAAELRDSSEFERWRSEAAKREEEEERRRLEQRKLELARSAQAAVEASERARAERAVAVAAMKDDQRREEEARKEEQELEEAALRARAVELRQEVSQAVKRAEEELVAEKRRRRQQLRAESEQRLREKAQRDEEERLARADLIRQIRAVERVPVQRARAFDPTESSGVGVLEEMSLAELKERLRINKLRAEEEERLRRREIVRDRADRQEQLQSRMQRIERIRATAAASNRATRERRQRSQAEATETAQRAREEAAVEAAARLAQARAAREDETARVRAEEAAIAKKRLFLGAEKGQVEEAHFDQMIRGRERKARTTQSAHKKLAVADEEVKAREEGQRLRLIRAAAAAEAEQIAEQRARVEVARREQADRDFEELMDKKLRFQQTREWEHSALEQRGERNPYAAQLTRTLREEARTKTLQQTAQRALAQ